jgi:hypothetical protein
MLNIIFYAFIDLGSNRRQLAYLQIILLNLERRNCLKRILVGLLNTLYVPRIMLTFARLRANNWSIIGSLLYLLIWRRIRKPYYFLYIHHVICRLFNWWSDRWHVTLATTISLLMIFEIDFDFIFIADRNLMFNNLIIAELGRNFFPKNLIVFIDFNSHLLLLAWLRWIWSPIPNLKYEIVISEEFLLVERTEQLKMLLLNGKVNDLPSNDHD